MFRKLIYLSFIVFLLAIALISFANSGSWELDTYTYDSVYISTQDHNPSGLFFKPDGTKLYEIGYSSGGDIYQYTCLTPWDLSSCSYDSISLPTHDSGSRAIFFKPDGTKMYETGTATDTIYQSTCSDAWNLSSCSYDNVNISTQDGGPTGIFFKSDGLKLYEIGYSGDKVYQYTCLTPWNLSSCTYDNVNIPTQDSVTRDVAFSPDGIKLYEVGDSSNTIFQLTCTDAWNISSCSYDSISLPTQDGNPAGLFFKTDGAKVYEIGYSGDKIYQYSTVAADTCTCPGSGENWEIDLSDNCVISDSCDLGTGNITFTGTGNITFDAIITAFSIGELPANQRGFLTSSAEVNVG